MKLFRTGLILLTISAFIIIPTVVNAGVVISEFRTRGPNGAADEFVELYNNSDSAVDISGWKINASNNAGTTGTRVTINAGTTIPARGHFLATNATPTTGYSGSVTGNQTYTTGIADDGGVALLMADNTVVDQVGMSTGSAYKEGSVLAPLTTNTNQSYERKPNDGLGNRQDTNDNAADFQVLAPSNPQNLFADQVVTDLGDDGGPNQLRAKISASINGGGGTITFMSGLSGTIGLNSALPNISSAMTIEGGNAVTISGNDAYRIFNIDAAAMLVLKNMTLAHAYATGDGGAISSLGALIATNVKFLNNATSANASGSALVCWKTLTLTGCEFGSNTGGGGAVKLRSNEANTTISACNFHDNTSTYSGGGGYGGAMQIFDGPDVTISSSTFKNNSGFEGGAIYVSSISNLFVDSTSFIGNTADDSGGAIYNVFGATVTYCMFADNEAHSGGAIFNGPNTGLSIDTSTFSGNMATPLDGTDSKGGAVYNDGVANVTNSSFSGNTAYAPFNSQFYHASGGALFNDSDGQLTVINCTLSGNITGGTGGGLGTVSNVRTFVGEDTFSGNSATNGGGAVAASVSAAIGIVNIIVANSQSGGNCLGVSAGNGNFSLSDDNTCGFGLNAGGGRDNVTNLLLGPLANNGGPTQTHLPQAGSAAINTGTSSTISRDQRGFVRDSMPDVGAVEVGGTLLPAPTSVVSAKIHGASSFGIDLPLIGNGAVECRTGGANGNHQIVLNFASPVSSTGASITKGAGSVSSYSVNGSQVIINLTGVTNAQSIFATIFDVSDGTNVNDITIPVGFLIGDTTGDGSVNSADISQTKSKSGQVVGSSNFRNDVTVDGSLNSADISLVKSKSGTALP